MAFNLPKTKPFFVLAPMDDVTDTVFRQVVQSTHAPDLFFTEFANVDGLQSPGRPRLLNGDVESKEHGQELATKYGLDGIMIGRGVFHDPYVFADKSPWETIGREERIALFTRHVELFRATWQQNERPVYTLNKFCKIYINGFDGAKELREDLMAATSPDDLLYKLQAILTPVA
jgi:tRNA-dihydrouridine synthase